MRLDKFLCENDIGTRSEVKKLIKAGFVTVNDEVITSAQVHIDENKDVVMLDGIEITYSKYRYFLLHKPAGCVSAVYDNVHPTVMDYLVGENIKDCAPVGRLDIDTEGLIIITNDGKLAHKLTSPTHHVDKTYFAILDKPCPIEAIELFKRGVDIGDDTKTLPASLVIKDDRTKVNITIHEGRFHQVKRMFETVGCHVEYLRRDKMGEYELGDLKPGEYRVI